MAMSLASSSSPVPDSSRCSLPHQKMSEWNTQSALPDVGVEPAALWGRGLRIGYHPAAVGIDSW